MYTRSQAKKDGGSMPPVFGEEFVSGSYNIKKKCKRTQKKLKLPFIEEIETLNRFEKELADLNNTDLAGLSEICSHTHVEGLSDNTVVV